MALTMDIEFQGATITGAYLVAANIRTGKPKRVDLTDLEQLGDIDSLEGEALNNANQLYKVASDGYTLNLRNGFVEFDVYLYASEEARENNKPMNNGGSIYSGRKAHPYGDSVLVSDIYDYIKTLPKFQGAQDV